MTSDNRPDGWDFPGVCKTAGPGGSPCARCVSGLWAMVWLPSHTPRPRAYSVRVERPGRRIMIAGAAGMSRTDVAADFAELTGADTGQIRVRKIRGPSWRRNHPAQPGRTGR